MGNSESQYSIQGPRGPSFLFLGKQKPYLAKDDALSPHSWWKNVPVGPRRPSRGCVSPPKTRRTYFARPCDEHRCHQSSGCGIRRRHPSDEDNPYGAELNGHCGTALEEQSSPRVVIRKDGTLRVEFTNTVGNPLILGDIAGPVQLLKFSPNLESPSTPGLQDVPPLASTSSIARTSKGSSLSSDGSWYDNPWGPSSELCEQDQSRTTPVHQLGSFSEQPPQLSITDLYRDPSMAATFPTASHLQEPPPRIHRVSLASILDVPLEEESLEPTRQYSSYTLPCRRPKAHTISEDLGQYVEREPVGVDFIFQKKDSIKNRIRRFSDWTGSLGRRKRKSQDSSRLRDLSDAFDSGVDGLTADNSSPSQVSSLLWGPGASRAQSSGAINQSASHALRQNIYENFMRELETGGERREPSTEDDGGSSSDSAEGSVEQLELLFEKEQGVVRRAGWLSFKPLITLHHDRKLELLTRRRWKNFWVTLKGCSLLFYENYSKGSSEQDLSPRFVLLAEDSIVQAVPEHPKRENVFCLSNSYGDVYLFQASNQTDLENWVTAVHSASASLLAKRRGKEDTVRLLRLQVAALLQKIDMDGKMKKMAELQLTVVSEARNRRAIENQIQQWEQNLEKFNMDLFRMRCYLSSLQGGELPNPKSLLATASRPTKTTLGRLGVFSVSSFHALICSRDEATVRRRSLSLGHTQRNRGLLSSLKGLDNLTKRNRDKRPSVAQVFEDDCGGQTFVQSSRSTEADSQLEAVQANVFTLLMRPSSTRDYGFAVTGHIDNQKNSRIYVSDVLPDGLAFNEGLRPGDEILLLNGRCVSSLDLDYIQTLFSEQTLQLSLRRGRASENQTPTRICNQEGHNRHHRAKSSSVYAAVGGSDSAALDDIPSHRPVQHSKSVDAVCTLYHSFQEGTGPGDVMDNARDPSMRLGGAPGPEPSANYPKHMSATERLRKVIQELVDTEKSYVKDLTCLLEIYLKPLQNETFLTLDEMESLFGSLPEMLDFQRVFLQTLEDGIACSPDFSSLDTPSQFKKLLFSLGGSFLYYADHFKLYSGFCANHIKVQKVLERAKTDHTFKEFLDARNPTKQHSTTLESYLIKPVQRVLKYPLLLRELISVTEGDSEEHYHLTEALKAMEKVASHINEMQKIYEDYGSVFDQLVAEQASHDQELDFIQPPEPKKQQHPFSAMRTKKSQEMSVQRRLLIQVTEISMGEFLMHSSVVWINPHPSLGRLRKDPQITVFVFRKAVILVYRENNKLKKKMTNPRSHGELDPFKFRWLIPLSALQVRLGNAAGTGPQSSCVWELIHCRSQVEGRPETVFQLCSSVAEGKVGVVKVIRSILRENVRRNMKGGEGTLERSSREKITPLGFSLPSSARIGSSRASWVCRQPPGEFSSQGGTPTMGPDSDEGSLSSGTSSGPAPPPPPPPPDHQQIWSQGFTSELPSSVKESDILSDDDGFSEGCGVLRRDSEDGGGGLKRNDDNSSSPISAIEAQFVHLKLSEDAVPQCLPAPRVLPERLGDTPEVQPKLLRGHFNLMKRRSNSLRRSRGILVAMREQSRSLDGQTDGETTDLNALLDKEFSVQSLTSVVNEEIFFEPKTEVGNDASA
ncbi:rho guanine nucleotide exchange factor TIAM2 isoform 2-T4 [Pholidichthys leucotaenia]